MPNLMKELVPTLSQRLKKEDIEKYIQVLNHEIGFIALESIIDHVGSIDNKDDLIAYLDRLR